MYPIESETSSQTNLNLKINWKKVFGLIFIGCLSLALILAIFMGLKSDDETNTLKQCDCSSIGSIEDCDDNGDCICKHGFAGRKCDKCKDGFSGNKCDACQPNYYNYPFCQGILTIFWKANPTQFLISECNCNPFGSTTLECGNSNGVCTCKDGFTGIKCHECSLPKVAGDKCDTCQPSFFDFPSCQKGFL